MLWVEQTDVLVARSSLGVNFSIRRALDDGWWLLEGGQPIDKYPTLDAAKQFALAMHRKALSSLIRPLVWKECMAASTFLFEASGLYGSKFHIGLLGLHGFVAFSPNHVGPTRLSVSHCKQKAKEDCDAYHRAEVIKWLQ